MQGSPVNFMKYEDLIDYNAGFHFFRPSPPEI